MIFFFSEEEISIKVDDKHFFFFFATSTARELSCFFTCPIFHSLRSLTALFQLLLMFESIFTDFFCVLFTNHSRCFCTKTSSFFSFLFERGCGRCEDSHCILI